MRFLLQSLLSATLLTASRAVASDSPAPALSLADLEARAPKENTYPNFSADFHQAVIRLVESNTLATGDEFYRASVLLGGFFDRSRSARIHYELMLAAAAKGHLGAKNSVGDAWDSLLVAFGRPMRLDLWGQVASSPIPESLSLDPAPKVIQDVLRHPLEAMEAASKVTDNAEVQKIVDADQADRANWNKLSEAEMKAMPANDQQRNLRVREIVKEGGLHTAKDFANASMVMQHSPAFAGYQLAHELAVCSMLLGNHGMGRWLVAATYDRMLVSIGFYQRFGTQGAAMLTPQSKTEPSEVDETGICDAERLALGCPTLAAKRANFWAPKPSS